jgi:hypothetical protein
VISILVDHIRPGLASQEFYPEVMNEMEKLLRTPALRGCNLAVDQTGVGRRVVDIFVQGLKHKVSARLIRFNNHRRS